MSEPIYDIGDFLETNVYAEGLQEAGDMKGDVPSEAQKLGPVYRMAGEGTELAGDSILEAVWVPYSGHGSTASRSPGSRTLPW